MLNKLIYTPINIIPLNIIKMSFYIPFLNIFLEKKLSIIIKINKIIPKRKFIFFTHRTNLKSSPDALDDAGGGFFTGFLFFLLSSYN